MAISDLQARQGKVDITVEIVEKSEPRTFSKFGKEGKVCNAKAKDQTGEITLTLWNEQADQVNVGDTVKITNGYVSEWQGEKQLSTGKFGQLEVIESAGDPNAPDKPSAVESVTPDEKIEAEVTESKEEPEKVLTEDEKKEEEVLCEACDNPPAEDTVTADEETETEVKESKEEPVFETPTLDEKKEAEEKLDIEEEKVE